jgi:hypothetical protein
MTLPSGIGPHEGREFELMRAGAKDVAYFFELEPKGLAEISADPSFLAMVFQSCELHGISVPCWIAYRVGFEKQAQRLKSLVLDPSTGWHKAREYEIGRILGYRDEDIEAFVAHVGAT